MATDTISQRTVDVVTPAAGESVSEGTILEWRVKVGEPIKLDETIVEISTDKVDLELPAPATGTVSEILVAEGETVTVGQVIARIAVGGEDAAPNGGSAPAPPAPEVGQQASGAPARESAAPPAGDGQPERTANGASGAGTVDVLTPAAGESVSEGTILEWRVKVGEPIKLDETIVEISTDKVDLELPAPASGTVSEILVAEGETVTVGQVIARIAVGASAGADGQASGDAAAAATGEPARSGAAGPRPGEPATPASSSAPEGVRVSPVAARAAAVEGVALEGIAGSGPSGRIT